MIRLKSALIVWTGVTRIGASALVVLLLVAGTAFGQVQYAITDLGTLDGISDFLSNSYAYGINNNGQVVGTSTTSDYHVSHAFLYSGSGPMQDLGSLFGDRGNSYAYGINDSGQVVGNSGGGNPHAFLYSGNGPMQDLGTLGGSSSYAYGINDSGQVVGYSITSSDQARAFLYSGSGPMQDLGSLFGESHAYGINNIGQVVGDSTANRSGGAHVFLYSGNGPMQDLGTLGSNSSASAKGINDSGQVVGNSGASSQNAFLYSGSGPMQDLGTLGAHWYKSWACGINNSGQVVGFSYDPFDVFYDRSSRAFLYSSGGPMQDLNNLISPSSGWILREATAINDKGQIVGRGTNPRGYTHAFLLSPLSPPTVTLIVSPSTTTAFGSLQAGRTADRTFNVSNVGTSTISGTTSVGAPFRVVSGGSYTLAQGQSRTVTVRYAPTAAGNNAAYVTFTGGGALTRQVTGSAYTDPTPTTGLIAGQVTRADTHAALNNVLITATGPRGSSSTRSGVSGGQAGRYSITTLPASAHYQVVATAEGQQFQTAEIGEVSVVAGQTTTVDIELTPSDQPLDPTPENTPVVLVRGYGPSMEWAADDERAWREMRRALEATGFTVWDPNEKEEGIMGGYGGVINGTYGIDQNANALKVYLKEKADKYRTTFGHGHYPPQIHFVAHSMGGLITRRALHDYDENGFPCSTAPLKVGKVVMLATPNCGSPVADVVLRPQMYGLLAQLIAANSAEFWMQAVWYSTKDLTPDNMRNQFNGANPWPSVPLYLFSASNSQYGKGRKWVNGTDDLCYLGDFAISKYNKLHGVQGTDERIHDGAVTQPSANGVYWTSKPTIHAVSNVTFRALPTSDASLWLENPVQSVTDSDLGRPLDHLFLLTDSAVISWVVETLLNPDPVPTAYTTNASARTQNAMSLNAGIAQQEIPERVFESLGGTVTNGTVAALPVAADASTTLTFELMASDTNIIFRLNDPSGTPIDGDTPQTNTNVQYTVSAVASNLLLATFTITNPMKGVWTAAIDAGSITSTQADYSLMVSGDSNIGLVPQTGPLFNQGQDVVVSCALADLSTDPVIPVVNASITATIQLPDSSTTNLALFDDGWHNDGAPNDGTYGAVLANVQQPGTYSITYRAVGTDSQGQALQRVATGGFSVSSGHGSLWGDPVYENLDTDGNGVADFLAVKCWVNPTAAGNYILAGDLVDAGGTHRFSQSAAFAADGSGPTMATLIFDLAEVRAQGGQGTFHIENLQLFEVMSTGTAWLDAYKGLSVVTLQAAKVMNVSPQNLAADVPQTTDLQWTDGGGASTYDVYFGTDAVSPPFKTNQTDTTYDPGTLAYNTTYYWRIDARNPAGVTTGDTWSFTTLPAPTPPTVTTTAASAIGTTTAASGGNVTSDGSAAVTARGVCWSTSANPTTTNSKTADGNGTGPFLSALTGLAPGTAYHIRAYATNSVDTSYGNDLIFTSFPPTSSLKVTALSRTGLTGRTVAMSATATLAASEYAVMEGAWNPTNAEWEPITGGATSSSARTFPCTFDLQPTVGTHKVYMAVRNTYLGLTSASRSLSVALTGPAVYSLSTTKVSGITATLAITVTGNPTEYAVMEGAWNAVTAVWKTIPAGTIVSGRLGFLADHGLQPTVGGHTLYVAVRDPVTTLTSATKSVTATVTGPAVYSLATSKVNGMTATLAVTVTGNPSQYAIIEGVWNVGAAAWKTIPAGTIVSGRLRFAADFALTPTAGSHTVSVAVRDPVTTLTSATKTIAITLAAPTVSALASAGVAGTTVTLRATAKGGPDQYAVMEGVWNAGAAVWQPITGATTTSTSLIFTFPFVLTPEARAHTVYVAVRNSLLNAVSAARSVRVTVAAPTVTSITPASGPAGSALVTLTGTAFGPTAGGAAKVEFGGVPGDIQTWSNTSVRCVVPATAPLGTVNVVLTTSAGLHAAPRVFTVLPFWYGNWSGTFQDTDDSLIGAGALEHGWMNGATTALLDGSMSLRLGTGEILTGTVNASGDSFVLTGVGRDGSALTLAGTVTADSLVGALDWSGAGGSGSRDLALGRPGVAAGVVSGTYVATVEDQFDSRELPAVPKAMLLAGSQTGGTVTLRDAVTGEVLTGPRLGDVFVVFSATRAIYGHITGVNSSGQVAAFEATYDWADAASFGWGEIDAGRSDGTAGVSRGTTLWNFNAVTAGGPTLLPATVLVGYSNAVTVTVSGLGGVQHITRGKIYHDPDGVGSTFVAREATLTLFGFWNGTVLDGGLEHQDLGVPFDSGDFAGTPR